MLPVFIITVLALETKQAENVKSAKARTSQTNMLQYLILLSLQ